MLRRKLTEPLFSFFPLGLPPQVDKQVTALKQSAHRRSVLMQKSEGGTKGSDLRRQLVVKVELNRLRESN